MRATDLLGVVHGKTHARGVEMVDLEASGVDRLVVGGEDELELARLLDDDVGCPVLVGMD